MNYELQRQSETPIEYNIDVAMNYGDIPSGFLMNKFEETDMGPDEHVYENYARQTLKDRRPDPISMASDEPRGGVNASSGRLQLQYYGHRGDAEPPSHPEMFIGFMGDNREPRGTAIDPDFKKIKSQHESRMRFIKMDPDASNHITGGGRSESQVQSDRIKIDKTLKDRIKVFSRQLNGRRPSMQGSWRRVSARLRQEDTVKYGDAVPDYMANFQRCNNIISKSIRDTRKFRRDNLDQELTVQKYTQLGRKRVNKVKQNAATVIAQDGKFSETDITKTFKTLGLLMNQVVQARTTLQKDVHQDSEYGAHSESQARKHEKIMRELTSVLRVLDHQTKWGNADYSLMFKTKMPGLAEHLSRVVSLNHLLPAAHYLTAEKMYKAVIPGRDKMLVKREIQNDQSAPDMEKVKQMFRKSSNNKSITGTRDKMRGDIEIIDNTFAVHSYKNAIGRINDKRTKMVRGEEFRHESDNTQFGRSNNSSHRTITTRDYENDARFYENYSKERHTGKMGNKSAASWKSERDMNNNGITEMN